MIAWWIHGEDRGIDAAQMHNAEKESQRNRFLRPVSDRSVHIDTNDYGYSGSKIVYSCGPWQAVNTHTERKKQKKITNNNINQMYTHEPEPKHLVDCRACAFRYIYIYILFYYRINFTFSLYARFVNLHKMGGCCCCCCIGSRLSIALICAGWPSIQVNRADRLCN